MSNEEGQNLRLRYLSTFASEALARAPPQHVRLINTPEVPHQVLFTYPTTPRVGPFRRLDPHRTAQGPQSLHKTTMGCMLTDPNYRAT